jgi:hypothetical protein
MDIPARQGRFGDLDTAMALIGSFVVRRAWAVEHSAYIMNRIICSTVRTRTPNMR